MMSKLMCIIDDETLGAYIVVILETFIVLVIFSPKAPLIWLGLL